MGETPRQPTARGEVILARLAELSISLAEVERRSRLSKNTISNAIYGPRSPQRKTVEILADVLRMPVEDLTRTPDAAGTSDGSTPLAPPSFGSWLWRWDNKLLWVSVLGSSATAIFLLQGLQEKTISQYVQGTQLAVIVLLLTMLPRPWMPPAAYEAAAHRLKAASKAAQDLRRFWGWAWLCWMFLYLALTVTTSIGILPQAIRETPLPPEVRGSLLLLNFFQNCGTVLLCLCYEVVARPTIKEDLSRKQVLPTEAWLALVILVSFAEGITAWQAPGYQPWFGWLSGFGQGTALALLVGRFDSKYVDPPAISIGLLYLYAVIQGAWPVFRYHDDLMLVLTFLALVLKCLLFLFVSWLFESHVVLFYLGRMRQLDRSVRLDRAEFLERYQAGDVAEL